MLLSFGFHFDRNIGTFGMRRGKAMDMVVLWFKEGGHHTVRIPVEPQMEIGSGARQFGRLTKLTVEKKLGSSSR